MFHQTSFLINKILVHNVVLNHHDFRPIKGKINLIFDRPGEVNELRADQGNVRMSYFLKTLAGLLEPSCGEIFFNEINFYRVDFFQSIQARLAIGYSFDLGGLINNRTIYDNLILPLDYHNLLSSDERQVLVNALLRDFEIFEYSNELPAMVPGRVRKAVIVLRSLILNPQVLILDDPWAGLSEQQRRQFVSYINKRLKGGGLRFVFLYDSLNLKLFPSSTDWWIEYREGVMYDGVKTNAA